MTLNIEELFQELKRCCEPKDVYSVRKVASDLGINYDYIELCASEDEELNEILQLCRDICCVHAMDAGLYGRLPTREAYMYWCENDDGFAAEFGHEQFFDDENNGNS